MKWRSPLDADRLFRRIDPARSSRDSEGEDTDRAEMPSRRVLLRMGGLGILALSGCIGGTEADPETTTTRDVGTTENGTGAETTTEGSPFASTDYCSSPPETTLPKKVPSLTIDGTARDGFWCRGRPIEDFEGENQWEAWGGTTSVTTGSAASGSSSAHIRAAKSDNRCGIRRRFDPGIDLSGYDISVALRLEHPANEGVTVQLQAPDGDNAIQTHAYGWKDGWIRLDHGPREIDGKPDLTDVREIRIGMYRGEEAKGTAFLDGLRATKRRNRGVVLFTFDDNRITQYEKAFPILEEYGFTGAIGVIPWTVGKEDHIDLDELKEMSEAGWQMMSHPQEPESLRTLSRSETHDAIAESKRWLVDNGFDVGARSIVWPMGRYDANALRIANHYHHLGFSTSTGVAGRITDPLVVPRVNAGQPDQAREMIDIAARYNQLCVLMFHRIDDCDDENSICEDEMQELVKYVDRADVEVLSLEELQDELLATA